MLNVPPITLETPPMTLNKEAPSIVPTGETQFTASIAVSAVLRVPLSVSPRFRNTGNEVENSDPRAPLHITRDETSQPPKINDQLPAKATLPQVDQAQDWARHVHPEGWIYFFKRHADEPEGIECQEIRGGLEGTLIVTDTTMNISPSTDVTNYELLKGLGPLVVLGFGGLQVRTYVDHRRWYASEDKALLFRQQLTDDEGDILQLNYWTFMRDYPAHHSQLPPGAVVATRQALTCYAMEGLVRKSGTRAPFTLSESKALLEYLDAIERDDEGDLKKLPATARLPSRSSMRTILVAWVLLNVAKHRQTNKYGHTTFEDARKAESSGQPGVVFMLVSSICLFVPLDHRVHICAAKRSSELRGDIETWPAYIDTLVREWSTFNLAATVLLSGSVGFLAVPGLGSVTQIIVLSSVVLTLGSIITGVYLLWRHQGEGERLEYSISLLHSEFHINLLAIILSTPFTFLVWGVLTFLVAVMSYSFQWSYIPSRKMVFIVVFVLSTTVLMVVLISFIFFRSLRRRRGSALYM